MNRKLMYALLLLTVVALIGVPQVSANQDFMNAFNTTYPFAVGSRIDNCALCHQGGVGGAPRNPYGLDFENQTGHRTNPGPALVSIEGNDSDKDTFKNIDEIRNFTYPGDPTDFPPRITNFAPSSPVTSTGAPATQMFNVTVNQVVDNLTWSVDGNVHKTDHTLSTSSDTITVNAVGMHTVTFTAQRTGDGTAMQNWTWNVAPSANGTISGKVTNASSTLAILGATVTAGGMTATTDASGNYNISIAPGTYTVKATMSGFQDGTASVTVTANNVTTQNFALTPTPPTVANGTISGKVTNASSTLAILGATVTAGGMT
ncbi:MAG TPA: carboxypeptidase-like regulatory domain-containing protein, partial [Candidatus Methanoperedens sp.]